MSGAGRLSYLDAAARVLERAGRPLTAREIAEQALREGLLQPTGKTPAATMSAALYTRAEQAGIVRLAEPGRSRAQRGTVRWALRAM